MTRKEFEEYERKVGEFFDQNGLASLTPISDENGEWSKGFSWHSCECCGNHLGGNRVDCNGWVPKTGEVLEFSVCDDCVYYAEYGELDDMTMMDMEE